MTSPSPTQDDASLPPSRRGLAGRVALAGVVLSAAILAATSFTVATGKAVVVTRFGAPVRVQAVPGLAWKLPAPLEMTQTVDMQTRTTSGGLQDVGTRDGLRILVQAFVAWSIPDDPEHIRHFLRATGNDPDGAARQLRSLLGSALQIVASDFALRDLINTTPEKVKIATFEDHLLTLLRPQAESIYGIRIEQVGLERLSLPAETLAATVARMRAERETVAAARTAEGLRKAAAIKADAERDSRITVATARAEAASTEAKAHEEAATIYAQSYSKDPDLYATLRTLDTLNAIAGQNMRLVMRTDTAPFSVLDGPKGTGQSIARAIGQMGNSDSTALAAERH
ncbi:protease modulator HflC [Acetobacter conturbans]|uniref:Protein HflC n=1 Tax=Acetobacter conturbans TaxID=1737472 RepID=A0ABX0K045_9PROT|nr:protease modulator HflC [Acetobacter conturbans]NHN87708.1 protease modulator HflC [Acetobacter conturbans]